MARRTSTKIPVGSVGGLELELPLIAFGSGGPCVTLLCGLHGDEPSSLFVMDALMRILDDDDVVGTIQIVPFSNPTAFVTGSRVAYLDFLNMNAVGLGSADGQITERVLAVLFDSVLRGSSAIVDCHEFSLRAPSVAVFPATGSKDAADTACRMLAAFEPELAWVPRMEEVADAKYASILTLSLLRQGIPSVLLEVPQNCQEDRDLLARVVQGLLNVLTVSGVRRGRLVSTAGEARTRAVTRVLYTSSEAGLVYPCESLQPMAEIAKGEKVALLVPFENWTPLHIVAQDCGILMEAPTASVVHTGSNLYSLGHERTLETEVIRNHWHDLFTSAVDGA